ncbi:hypothetical protein MLD38_022041 [Melastoma candidum]|uniref:Uncharacterized protein n=1 Tax=Melastoma candidum TaxID=119954 RepID=A0ACB9QIX6_9MYRT|nr:hypothetical protein MLD38_022041 [Melastoma candidum]
MPLSGILLFRVDQQDEGARCSLGPLVGEDKHHRPAVRGIVNLLKSCSKSKSAERVVLTSSISTITAKDDSGKWKSFVDKSCRISFDHVYTLLKTLTEEAAFECAQQNRSISLAHVEDICNDHIFLMEQPKPEGKYMG